MASSYIISALIVLIGYGWTINLMEIEKIDDMAIPLILVFGLFNLIV